MTLSKKLEQKIWDIQSNFELIQYQCILDSILSAAASYWVGLDENDFCVQHIGDDVIVFGGTNRLKWSVKTGFVPDRSYCSERFLANCKEIGVLPK